MYNFRTYKKMGFARITDKNDFRRLDRLALGFLANASLGRFSLESEEIELLDYFIFLDEFTVSKERQDAKLASFRNDDYQESYANQTQAEAEGELLITAISLFGAKLFYRGVSL